MRLLWEKEHFSTQTYSYALRTRTRTQIFWSTEPLRRRARGQNRTGWQGPARRTREEALEDVAVDYLLYTVRSNLHHRKIEGVSTSKGRNEAPTSPTAV